MHAEIHGSIQLLQVVREMPSMERMINGGSQEVQFDQNRREKDGLFLETRALRILSSQKQRLMA